MPGTDLKDEEMIKLPINVINEDKGGWKHTLTTAHAKLGELAKEAEALQTESGRYIRPIMLVRVERTGKDQRDTAFVHAEDAREYLIEKLGVRGEEIRLKTSESDELGSEDLLVETCPVRYIVTKDALREGWDCPFAYRADDSFQDHGQHRPDPDDWPGAAPAPCPTDPPRRLG